MKQQWKAFMLVSALGTCAAAYQTPAVSQSQPHPSGTVVTRNSANTEVQPATKMVGLTPAIIRTAQVKLNSKGYNAGPATGRMNVRTRRAVHNFQRDEKLTVNGSLDENTLSHLNVGGSDTFGAAPGDIGRGGKAAGHDIAGGHPIAAAKAIGVGIGRSEKKVGEGTKSLAISGKDKVTGDSKTNDVPR